MTVKFHEIEKEEIDMFSRIPQTRTPIFQRLWLIAGECIASNNPNRWLEQATKINLRKLSSYKDSDTGQTKYKYYSLNLSGSICKESKPAQNSLHPFWDAMRMVAEAFTRAESVGSQFLQRGELETNPKVIKLDATQVEILKNHPQYQNLLGVFNKKGVDLELVAAGQELYTFSCQELTTV